MYYKNVIKNEMVKQFLFLSNSFLFVCFSPCSSPYLYLSRTFTIIMFIFYRSNNFLYRIHTLTYDKFLFTDQRGEKVVDLLFHMNQLLKVSILMKVKLTMRSIPCNSFPKIIYNIYFTN